MYQSKNIVVIFAALLIASSYAIIIPYREFSSSPALGRGPPFGTSTDADSPPYGGINFFINYAREYTQILPDHPVHSLRRLGTHKLVVA